MEQAILNQTTKVTKRLPGSEEYRGVRRQVQYQERGHWGQQLNKKATKEEYMVPRGVQVAQKVMDPPASQEVRPSWTLFSRTEPP